MADAKISALPAVLQQDIASTTDVLPIVNAGATKKATAYAITYSSLNASVATTFAYDATPTVATRIGVQGTGTSWIFNGPSPNPNYATGLVIDSTYDGGTLQAEINLRALGIYSGGGYGSELSLWTSLGTTITRQVTVKNNGDVQFKTGNLVIGTSGKGIDFSATPGTGTSELLSDYEEGTWNAGVSFGGAATGITYFNFVGYYTKIGNLVTVSGYLNMSSKGSSTGAARITGLPFAAVNNSSAYAAPALFFSNLTYSGQVAGYINIADTTIDVMQTTEAGSASALTDANFTDNTSFILNLTYRAA